MRPGAGKGILAAARAGVLAAGWVTLCAAGGGAQARAPAGGIQEEDRLALEVVAATIAHFHEAADAAWPGFDLSREVVLPYVPGRFALLLHPPAPLLHASAETGGGEGFVPYPEDALPLGVPAMLRTPPPADLVGQLSFDREIDGARAVAIPLMRELLPPGETLPHLRLLAFLVHESFHQYQNRAFGAVETLAEERYPILDVENTALAVLEMRVLLQGLEAPGGDALEEAARRFVAVRRTRWKRAEPFLRDFESRLEIVEGTAQYVEVRTIEALRERIQKASLPPALLPLAAETAALLPGAYLRRNFTDRLRGGTLSPRNVARNRVYPAGAALGILLDRLGADWKRRAASQGPRFTFAGAIEDRLGPLDDLSLARDLEAASRAHDLDAIREATRREVDRYGRGLEAALASFLATGGTRVRILAAASELSRSRTSRSERWTADRGARVLADPYETYTLRRGGAHSLRLEIHHGGVLEETNDAAGTRTVTFFVSSLDRLEADGSPVDPATEASLAFRKLILEGQERRLRCEGGGTLRCEGGSIEVDLTSPGGP